jgi:hypothetical protein
MYKDENKVYQQATVKRPLGRSSELIPYGCLTSVQHLIF